MSNYLSLYSFTPERVDEQNQKGPFSPGVDFPISFSYNSTLFYPLSYFMGGFWFPPT